VIRRLFSAGETNPTLGTISAIAATLGLRVVLEPIPAKERELVVGALLPDGTPHPG